jgi:hypothetical protein
MLGDGSVDELLDAAKWVIHPAACQPPDMSGDVVIERVEPTALDAGLMAELADLWFRVSLIGTPRT